jgi:chloride channel protein, CIC family
VFFGVEIILREFSVDALFTVMLSAMIADAVAVGFLGDQRFLSGFPPGIALHHSRNYLLVAVLAVIAALIGLGFKNAVYKTEDLWDLAWKNRPEWARPVIGGIALGLILLALPQMYGVGYPVMFKAVAGDYALWFLLVLAAGKILACSMTLGMGGSGGVFAPSLFVGATSGMAFGVTADHLLGPGAGQPALYAVVAMGAVFASAARAPLTSVASVVEMTGDFTLTLPVMLAVAVAAATSRALSYSTIYTAKLLRRGYDIDRAAPWRAFRDLKAADAMRPFPAPLAVDRPQGDGEPARNGSHPVHGPASLPGPVTSKRDPQGVYATESLAQTLRQLCAYGRDGLPVISDNGRQVRGWISSASVLHAVAAKIGSSPPHVSRSAVGPDAHSPPTAGPQPPAPLPGYQVLEVTISAGSPAVGMTLGSIRWPTGSIPVSVLRDRRLEEPAPGLTLTAGDRVSLLAPALPGPAPRLPARTDGDCGP